MRMVTLNTNCPLLESPADIPDDWPPSFISSDAGRFKARYRVASQFKSVLFADSIGVPTAQGYSRLIHFFFVYSAWEQFRKTFHQSNTSLLAEKHDTSKLKTFIERQRALRKKLHAQSMDPRDSLFDHLSRSARKRLRSKIEAIIAGEEYTIDDLAAATRNAFFHGELTPNASGGGVVELVTLLSAHYLTVMRKEAGALATESLQSPNS